jgi:hypothetical protein
MKKNLLSALALVACVLSAQAQYFTQGNLAVVRVGGNVTTNGNPVFIDQYTTGGSLVNSVDLPTTGPSAFVLDNSTGEGYVTLSQNGIYLVLGGYNAPVGTGYGTEYGLNGTASAAVPRSIGTIDGYGNYVLQITNNLAFTAWAITSAVSDGTNNFWMAGQSSDNQYLGVLYVGTPSSPTTVNVANTGGEEEAVLNIFNGSLFIDSSYSPNGIYQINDVNPPITPLPEDTNSVTDVIPLPGSSRNVDYVFDPGMTTCYYADSSVGIVKFTNNAGTWVAAYTNSAATTGFTTKGARGITADWTQNPVVVYATTAESTGNRLIELVDSGSAAVATLIAQAPTNHVSTTNVFRGVRFTPAAPPMITVQPAPIVQSADGTATFSVTAAGTPTLSYQWYTNGTPVPGATSSSLTVNSVTTFESGTLFSVVVTNAYGTVTSSNALLTVNPSYFIPGNLVVENIGGPGQNPQNTGSTGTGVTVSILQFTTNAGQSAPVSTLTLPTTGPTAFSVTGGFTEGFMSLDPSGGHLVIPGYNSAIPLAGGPAAASALTAPRSIALIDGYGNYTLPIANTNAMSTYNIRGGAYDGINFWACGNGAPSGSPKGILYLGTSGAKNTEVQVGITGSGNERCLNVYNNTLYVSTGSASRGIFAVPGTGFPPTTGANTNTVETIVMGTGTVSPYDFVFDPANTTCYVADSDLGIVKFTNNAGTWVSNYTLSAATPGYPTVTAVGVTADFTQNPPVIYATTGESVSNRLISIVDSGATATATFLYQTAATAAGTNVMHGVRFVPGVPPSVSGQPASFTQDAGGNATFTVTATGTPTLTYQWFTNSTPVPGATTSTLELDNVTLDLNGTMIYAVVSNNYGFATSSNATLTVQPQGAPLNVTILPPTSLTVNAGGTATFNLSAVGSDLTFYWYQNGNPIASTTSSSLVISPAFAIDDGTYTVTATNSFGGASGNNSATLTVIDPVIVTQPAGSTNLPSGSASLSVVAVGTPTLTYQWYSNNVSIAGATASTLNLNNNGVSVAASYSVVVTNGLGNSVTSESTIVAFSPYLLYETFSYPNGNLFAESPWTDINGSNPELVTNGRVQINQANFTTDAQRLFTQPEGGTILWASFNINLTTLPSSANGTYIANLEDTNFGFYARVFTLTSNAFPGTYRLGIANNANDYSTSTKKGGPAAVVPLDLAPGINYEVVLYYDMVNQFSGLAINPANYAQDGYVFTQTPVNSGPALDSYTPSGLPMAAFGLRQRENEGVLTLGNLEVSFDYNVAGSGYAAVTAGLTPAKPVIGFQPPGVTNYSGNSFLTEVAASGIGAPGVGLSYSWYQNGELLTNGADGGTIEGATNAALAISDLNSTNAGTYYVIVSNSAGMTQSSNVIVSVNSTPTAPFFTSFSPVNATNSLGTSVTFTGAAAGTGPLSYAWELNGSPLSDNGSTIIGSQTPSLTLSTLVTNEAGTYTLVVTGGTSEQASTNAYLTVVPPASVSIGYLRTLLNPTTYTADDTVDNFTVTGVITTFTNLTSGNTASYYLQDSTGGLNLFLTDGSTFRPMAGDVVTATGTLSVYADNFELDVTYGGAVQTALILTNSDGSIRTNALPNPIILPWGYIAANQNYVETNIEGSRVMLTNVFFETPGVLFSNGVIYAVTNNTGQTFNIYLSDQDTNLNNVMVPAFAYSVTAPLVQDDTTFELDLTDVSEIVSAPPPAPTVSAAAVAANGANTVTLTWTAVPYSYSYSVLYATNVAGPWGSLASGLAFTNTLGTYTDIQRTNSVGFYEVTSP